MKQLTISELQKHLSDIQRVCGDLPITFHEADADLDFLLKEYKVTSFSRLVIVFEVEHGDNINE